MKKVLSVSLLSMAALLPLRAQAQVLCTLGPATSPYDPMADMPAGAGPQADLKKVKALLCPKGCGKVLLFANATAPNAATVTDGAGTSKISYSPAFAGSVQKAFGPIATFAVVAHGVGHHLDATGNRPDWMNQAWDSELRADAWAGCAMAKAELTPSRLQAVLLALSTYPSTHHPAWSARRPVITEGYTHCGGKVLPPLASESPQPNSKGDRGRDDDGPIAAGAPGGCTGAKDCRNGRACMAGRCAAPGSRRCGKDTDCPEPQECDPTGTCAGPAHQARADDEPAKPNGPVLASLQGERPTANPASPSPDAPACVRSCDEIRKVCVEAATSAASKCTAAIQSDPGYRSCSCPSYPTGDVTCYRVCANAYERGQGCSAESSLRECKSQSDHCRSQCQ
jgi:hypothetical protein